MNRTSVKLAVVGSLVALALTAAGCGSSMSDHEMGSAATPAASSSPAAATPAAGPHNDADVRFATMMIPHHTQAIEMSDVLLSKTGIDPGVTDLARRIKAAQAPEVDQMDGWLAGWEPDSGAGGMGGMDHDSGDEMMSQTDMDALNDAQGDKAGTLFLTGMVKHHQGAVLMARTELREGSNPAAQQLAKTIIATQNSEIAEMNKLLAG